LFKAAKRKSKQGKGTIGTAGLLYERPWKAQP